MLGSLMMGEDGVDGKTGFETRGETEEDDMKRRLCEGLCSSVDDVERRICEELCSSEDDEGIPLNT